MGKNRRKVGLVMGTFDPIHIGHLNLIGEALNRGMDFILVVPTARNPWKDEPKASFEARCIMAETACFDMFPGNTAVEPGGMYENLLQEPYAYYQLTNIVEKYGENDYYIIGGTDVGESIKVWKNYDSCIKDFFKPLIVDRTIINISSTMVRDLLRDGKDPRPYVLRSVYNYIKKNNLYE